MFHSERDGPHPVGLAPCDAEGSPLEGLQRETIPGFEHGLASPARRRLRRPLHPIWPSNDEKSITQATGGRAGTSRKRRPACPGGTEEIPLSEPGAPMRQFPAVDSKKATRGPSAETTTTPHTRSARPGHLMSSPFRPWGAHSNLPLSPTATETRRPASPRSLQDERREIGRASCRER